MAAPNVRMRKLKPSRLQLDEYRLEAFSLKVNDGAQGEKAEEPIALAYSVDYLESSEGNTGERLIRLRVRSQRSRSRKYLYEIDVTVAGVFSFTQAIEDEGFQARLIQYNAPAMLYGVIRGIVGSLTAQTSHGRLELPSANFAA